MSKLALPSNVQSQPRVPAASRRRMTHASRFALRTAFAAVALAAAIVATPAAHAIGALGDITVVDRTTGQSLPLTYAQGRYWVAGTPGNRYAIQVRNQSGGRLLAVVAVDGVNAVSGQTAAWDQNGYVFAPWQSWQITGWRKSQERVAAFEFTALADSYAARTGRPDHVGVIGVALFRERQRVVPPPATLEQRGRVQPFDESGAANRDAARESARSESQDASKAESSTAPARQRADEPAGALADSAGRAAEKDSDARILPRAQAPAPAPKLGTGHGRSEDSRVSMTDFERASTTPDEVISIYYDSRERLIAAGILPSPRGREPSPFPGSTLGFVPDPPRW